ncbi:MULTISPECIES: hypothetical protein [unclassified Streptomyces]|uniref:hypothetical protein n=1 Tax=Streptomyces TaxID=1883 RepID=UPI00378A2AF6
MTPDRYGSPVRGFTGRSRTHSGIVGTDSTFVQREEDGPMWMWETGEFGRVHQGRPGALLADGSEPEPLVFDIGSSGSVHRSSDWWVYSGELNRPVATALRGVCACGWRGKSTYPLDWDKVDRQAPDFYDTSGPHTDWTQHIRDDVEAHAVPVPAELAMLLDQVAQRVTCLTDDEPLAAIRVMAILEHIVKDNGPLAAQIAQADAEENGTDIGRSLGLPTADARQRLLHYRLLR